MASSFSLSPMHVIGAIALIFSAVVRPTQAGSCTPMNNCNGHGTCDTVNSKCNCFAGWGADSDLATYKAPDCR
jgi:hypothetical protein